ncbi:MAG: glycosyltransferase family 4 protein [archaeon]|nr:glycosyltransferase family 4 protein [archaeon]
MKILHIASNYPPKIGGPATTVPQLCTELRKNNIECIVATHGYNGSKSKSSENGITVYRTKDSSAEFYNCLSAIKRTYLLSRLAREIIKKEKTDIIHAHDMNISAISGIIGSIGTKTRKIAKYPGDLAWETANMKSLTAKTPEEFFKKNSIKTKAYHLIQKFICMRYDKIIAPSNYMKKWLIKNSSVNPQKIRVIYNAINKEKYSPTEIMNLRKRLLGKNKHLVISACRMVPWKGLDLLVKSFDNMPKDTKLILVGDGPEKERLKSMAKGKNIEFTGKIDHSEIQAYLKASDIFVQPSHYEPSSIALLDCLATQTLIIASNVGGTPEIIEHKKTGILIKNNTPKSY